jgi:hypothetical protein
MQSFHGDPRSGQDLVAFVLVAQQRTPLQEALIWNELLLDARSMESKDELAYPRAWTTVCLSPLITRFSKRRQMRVGRVTS